MLQVGATGIHQPANQPLQFSIRSDTEALYYGVIYMYLAILWQCMDYFMVIMNVNY
jgi:hypothetical protein